MSANGYKHAIKHGLYSRRLSQEEIELIGITPVLDVDGEIGYLRAVINRLGNILEHNGLAPDTTDGLTLDTRSTVKLMEQAMGRLEAFIRLRNLLKSDLAEEYRAEMERGKNIGREHRHVFDYFKPPAPETPPPGQRSAGRRNSGSGKKRKA